METLAHFGQFLSGIGLVVTATVAVTTLVFFQRRTMESQWLDSFRRLYAEFWETPESAQVRRWLTNTKEYEDIKNILIDRLGSDENGLDTDANDNIEKLDRFCALMVRVTSFGTRSMTSRQRELYDRIYGAFWIQKIRGRREVVRYIEKYGPGLYTEVK